ncbi:MAG: hypothetical protein Q8K99_06280 [Actinomycetota bacterium]|nr:hypothetical protein [Actinomycetota bacterium]
MPEEAETPTSHVLEIDDSTHSHSADEVTLPLDARFLFTWQFLAGAAAQAGLAQDIEADDIEFDDTPKIVLHRSLVLGAIMQSTAAMEAEAWDVVHHGPGHHHGAGGIDQTSLDFLSPLAGMIDKQPALSRFETILHLLGREPLNRGEQPWQDAALLVNLRNELVHYKSTWGSESERKDFAKALRGKGFVLPSFIRENLAGGYFPLKCLNAACATWAVGASLGFLDGFYERLGIDSPLDSHRHLIERGSWQQAPAQQAHQPDGQQVD